MNEDLKKMAERYGWELEVWHGEYRGVLYDVQPGCNGDGPMPIYMFPGGPGMG